MGASRYNGGFEEAQLKVNPSLIWLVKPDELIRTKWPI